MYPSAGAKSLEKNAYGSRRSDLFVNDEKFVMTKDANTSYGGARWIRMMKIKVLVGSRIKMME